MAIPFETIDRIQDILSIPIAMWICYSLWDIRRKLKVKTGEKFCIYCQGEGVTQPVYLEGDYEDCSKCKGTGYVK